MSAIDFIQIKKTLAKEEFKIIVNHQAEWTNKKLLKMHFNNLIKARNKLNIHHVATACLDKNKMKKKIILIWKLFVNNSMSSNLLLKIKM